MAQTENNKAQQQEKQTVSAAIPSIGEWFRPETWTKFNGVGEQWVKTAEEHISRVGSALEEFAKTEKAALDQAHGVVQEMSRLTLASIDYSAKLAGEWRRSMYEAGRKGLDLMHPKA